LVNSRTASLLNRKIKIYQWGIDIEGTGKKILREGKN